MTLSDIAQLRLQNHQLARPQFTQVGDLVSWLGAVQAQDYAGAKWALAQRLPGTTHAAVEQAFAAGAMLRTHLLRPTWHFVAPADLRWLLALTGPRVHRLNDLYYRKSGLDAATFAHSHSVLEQALQGGNHRTREELALALQQADIATAGEFRLAYLMMHAELEGLICSGPRRGNQFTYALLEERVPATRPWERDEALAELVKRYFYSHGPATVPDFVWWSGLTVADANAGIAALGQQLQQAMIDGKSYWFAPNLTAASPTSPIAWLLTTYDEFLLSYADRSASLDPQAAHMWNGISQKFTSSIVIDGRVVGVWRRTLKAKSVLIETHRFRPLTAGEESALAAAIERYGQFLALAVVRV